MEFDLKADLEREAGSAARFGLTVHQSATVEQMETIIRPTVAVFWESVEKATPEKGGVPTELAILGAVNVFKVIASWLMEEMPTPEAKKALSGVLVLKTGLVLEDVTQMRFVRKISEEEGE